MPQLRRLRQLCACLRPPATSPSPAARPTAFGEPDAASLGLPLQQGTDGRPLASELARLHALKAEAAAQEDFRRATALADILGVFESPQLRLEECAPDTVDGQVRGHQLGGRDQGLLPS